MIDLTESKRNEVIAELWANAKTEHNCDSHNVPHTVVDFICEVDRALYVLLLAWEDTQSNPMKLLKTYMVKETVQNYVATEVLRYEDTKIVEEASKPVERRSDKYGKLEKLALENVFKEYTTDELMEISGLSRPPLLAWLKTNGFFRGLKRGAWEARNPKDDRENERL